MNKKNIAFLMMTLVAVVSIHSAQAALIPRKTAADRHIKTVNYDPNNVVIIHGCYGYQTQIVFAANEVIQNISIGDSLAWQAVPVGHHLFIKPMAASKTNMTVLTNVNSYNFQLDSNDPKVSPTYKLQFTYPVVGYDKNGHSNAITVCDPTQINWKYSFTGSKGLAPYEAFDCNGQFTYFRFNANRSMRQGEHCASNAKSKSPR